MAGILDYLEWRGDISFETDQFNEIDALILSELAYTNFENFPDDGSEIDISAAKNEFFKRHTRQEILDATSYTAKAPLLMDEMVSGVRFGNTKIFRYINEIDREKDAQIAAMTFLLDDGTAFVAFRGTDGTVVGWKEDFDLSYMPRTEGQRRAVRYLNDISVTVNRPLRVGGHSKGGNFACFAASFCDKSVQDRIIEVYSFDGPGFKKETLSEPGYRRILPKIIHIVPDTSIIGTLLLSESRRIVVKSVASGLVQHDGFSWCVKRNRFLQTQVSEMGCLIEKTMGDWLEQMDDEARRFLTDTVFTVLAATGNDTFHDMSEQKLKTTQAIIMSMVQLPKFKRQELTNLIRKLFETGSHAAVAYLPGNRVK